MAQLLTDPQSSSAHLNSARRHIRLARQLGQPAYAEAIQPAVADLKAADEEHEEAEFEVESAYDLVRARDLTLDNLVRDTFAAAESHDRHHTPPVRALLFPEGGFGALIEEPLAHQPRAVDELVSRIQGLGKTHLLAPHAEALAAGAKGVTDALTAHEAAIRLRNQKHGEAEISQARLRRQYAANYGNALATHGRRLADQLFPVVGGRSKASLPAVPAAENGSAAS